MVSQDVTVFEPYDFSPGEKIRINGGPRSGDWEVLSVTEKKVRLRCPISGTEVEWARFCYHREELKDAPWPNKEPDDR